jgi:hypothetical protein
MSSIRAEAARPPRRGVAARLAAGCGLLVLLFAIPGRSLTVDAPLKATARQAIGQMIGSDYPAAFRLADSLVKADPDEPMGHVLRLLTFGLRMIDYDEFLDSAGFLSTYSQAITSLNAYERRHGPSSYSLTMAGFAKAIHASFYLQQKRYLSALNTGMDALKLLDEAKTSDAANVDVDFFLGMYDYARAELRRKLWMVMFWYPGDKQQGRKRLEACGRDAEIAGDAARLALIDIYIQEERFAQAVELIAGMRQRYPQSRFVAWGQARYCLARKEFDAAAARFNQLALSYEADRLAGFNALTTRRQQIECLLKSGRSQEARQIGAAVLSRAAPQRRREIQEREKIVELIHRK